MLEWALRSHIATILYSEPLGHCLQPVGHNPFRVWMMTLSQVRLTPSENVGIYMTHNSNKIAVVKEQWKSFNGWGHQNIWTMQEGHSIRKVERTWELPISLRAKAEIATRGNQILCVPELWFIPHTVVMPSIEAQSLPGLPLLYGLTFQMFQGLCATCL